MQYESVQVVIVKHHICIKKDDENSKLSRGGEVTNKVCIKHTSANG